MFVSLRRRELKLMKELPWSVQTPCSSPYGDVSWNYDLCLSDVYHWVRLLTETWVEMPNNGKRGNLSDVRLLTETWVEMQKQLLCPRKPLRFVSLLGCELKYDEYVPRTRIWSSSPCGDVNWNFNCLWGSKCRCRYGSSPCGDVIWNNRSDMNKETALCSSPCGDVSWNTPVKSSIV